MRAPTMGVPTRNDNARREAGAGAQQSNSDTGIVARTGGAGNGREEPEHRGERRRFIVWCAMCGYIGPERLSERILAELADENGVAK